MKRTKHELGRRLLSLALVVLLLLSLVACANNNTPPHEAVSDNTADTSKPENEDTAESDSEDTAPSETPDESEGPAFVVSDNDEEIYFNALGDFYDLYQQAMEAGTVSERHALLAISEAKFLESAVGTPMHAPYVAYNMTRAVYNSYGYSPWRGTMNNDLTKPYLTNEIIKAEDYHHLEDLWLDLRGTGTYLDEALAYLTEKGYTFTDTYNGTFSDSITSWSVFTTNNSTAVYPSVDFLFAYDAEGNMVPQMATGYELSEDGKTYTIHLREGQIWVDSQGRKVADLTADDWVASAQHLADMQNWKYDYLSMYVEGAAAYYNGETTDFSTVGVKAVDDYTLEYTLIEPCSYFLSMFQQAAFFPLCRSYFLSQGGAFGIAEYSEASASPSYTFGIDQNHIAYCGQFICTNYTEKNTITCVLNENYWNAENAHIKAINLVFDDGSDTTRTYDNFKKGITTSTYLNAAQQESAKESGDFDLYATTNRPNKATFMMWFNLNRQTYANVADGAAPSNKTDEQKEVARAALQNVHFRRALAFSIDRPLYVAQNAGEDLKYENNRNTMTPGDYVSLEEEVTIDINGTPTTFPAGTWYGEIVQAQLTADEFPVTVWDAEKQTTDGWDAWYNPELAAEELAIAVEELATLGYDITAENPVILDFPTNITSEIGERQNYVIKTAIEDALGGLVCVDLTVLNSTSEMQNVLNNVNFGSEINEDMGGLGTIGSDHSDPQCFTEGLLPYGDGALTYRFGLW